MGICPQGNYCPLSIGKRLCRFVKTSYEAREKGLRCIQIRIGRQEGPSRAIREIHIDEVSVRFLSFCLVITSICVPSSVFSHGRTQFHTSRIAPLWSLKNENRWLFSYGRTTTTVRTRPYDGSRSSVRSQSQVLSTVEMGAKDAFYTLEKVYTREYMFI